MATGSSGNCMPRSRGTPASTTAPAAGRFAVATLAAGAALRYAAALLTPGEAGRRRRRRYRAALAGPAR